MDVNSVNHVSRLPFSLEYKYQKLIQSSNPGDELPAPETCGQDSEEEASESARTL